MKPGDEITIGLVKMLIPKIGQIFYVKMPEDKDSTTMRLITVDENGATLKVVSKDTKE